MKKIYYIVSLAALITFTGCNREEYLGIKPYGELIPANVNDYRLLLDQVGTDFSSNGLNVVSPGFSKTYENQELMADDFGITDGLFNEFSETAIKKYTWDDNIFLPNQNDGDWDLLYAQIFTANVVIEEIMDASNGSLAEKKQLLAEAKMHRAYCYFSLVNLYGLHYNPSTASSNLAVPLRLTSAISGVEFPRASVQEIYDLIIEDMTASISDLPDLPPSNVLKLRPTKANANAFLSRVYLYMAEYTKALEAAENSLAIYNVITDYNTLGFNYPNLLDIENLEDNQEVLWSKASGAYNFLVASDEFIDLYSSDDLRKHLFAPLADFFGIAQPQMVLGYPYYINYRGQGFTVPEVLLTRAECNARLGNVTAAIDDLNALRINRIETATYVPLTSTDQAEVLNLVKLERRLEMVGNGLRFFDLKRYNEFDNANITLTRTLNSQTYTLPAGSNNWAIPVAQKYIIETPEIGENVRD